MRRSLLFWAAALAWVALLRVPYLTSPLYILDNDEAVLGIMARRMAEGSEFPLYFAGQNYGLAIFETAPAAAAFAVFGDGALVLALTMLLLFLAGLIPYSRAFRRITGSEAWSRILVLVLALLPGWVVWSLKARGLYVSGFVLTGVTLALLTKPEPSRAELSGAGLLVGVLGLIQPIWLTVTVPFAIVFRDRLPDLVPAGLLAGAVWLIAAVLGPSGEAFWQPDVVQGVHPLRLTALPVAVSRAFSGRVFPADPGVLADFVGGVGAAGFLVLLVVMTVDAFRGRSRFAPAIALGMAASVLGIVVFRNWPPRYFLPSTVLAVLAAGAWIGARSIRPRRVPLWASMGLIALLGAAAAGVGRPAETSRPTEVPAEEDLRTLIAGLERDGVEGVYTPSSRVQWHLLFYGDGRIPVRGRSVTDRYPEFPRRVIEARRAGEPIAFVTEIRQLQDDMPQVDSFPGYRVGERYIRLDDPWVPLLLVMGFEPDPVESREAPHRRDP